MAGFFLGQLSGVHSVFDPFMLIDLLLPDRRSGRLGGGRETGDGQGPG